MDWKEYQTGRPKSMQSPLKKSWDISPTRLLQVQKSRPFSLERDGRHGAVRRESWSGELVKRQTANDNCSEVLSKSRRLVSSFYHASWACGDLTVYLLHGAE